MTVRSKAVALGAMVCPIVCAACAIHRVQPPPSFDAQARWVVLPFVNLAETPQAGEAAESIAATLLRVRGAADLNEYTSAPATLAELDDGHRQQTALTWARAQGFSYAMTGNVEEWRYRAGTDNEPAVGLTVSVIDLKTNRVVWSATGARAGWGNETVSGTANILLGELLEDLRVNATTSRSTNASARSAD